MHECLNVVAHGPEAVAGAVLFRALEPRRGGASSCVAGAVAPMIRTTACGGPARLCQAMAVDRSLRRPRPDDERRTWLAGRPGEAWRMARYRVGPRVGVDYAGDWAARPLRFWLTGNPSVSVGCRRVSLMDARSQELLEFPLSGRGWPRTRRSRRRAGLPRASCRRRSRSSSSGCSTRPTRRSICWDGGPMSASEVRATSASWSCGPGAAAGSTARSCSRSWTRSSPPVALWTCLRNERQPLLHELGRSIKPLPQLRARLEQSLDPSG